MSKLTLALVLCEIAAHQLKPGTLLEAEPALIKALAASGDVDPHKDSIAAAKERGCPVVRSAIELAAEQRAAARAALQVEIAKLQQLHDAAEAGEQKDALAAELLRQQQALAELAAD